MSGFKSLLVNNFPILGQYKRWFKGAIDHLGQTKQTYAQSQEDVFISEFLSAYNLKDSIYIDVGANHPTDISNTYLLYRQGYHGIIIEPNEELIKLFRRFRKRDILLMLGCSNKCGVVKFNISKTPVISSFDDNREDMNIWKRVFIPVMPLDNAISEIPFSFVNLLSIDVEGLNFEVLDGARATLKKTLLICIEFDTKDDAEKYDSVLLPDFQLVSTIGCNLFYANLHLTSLHRLTSES
jgi:FkbM family methyltransferase